MSLYDDLDIKEEAGSGKITKSSVVREYCLILLLRYHLAIDKLLTETHINYEVVTIRKITHNHNCN